MKDTTFCAGSIDHVELLVPGQREAARWYKQTLGLSICREYEFWADAGGPLMISADGGTTSLALFEGTSQNATTFGRVAFRVDGSEFLNVLDRLPDLELKNADGRRVTRSDAVDHDVSVSIYFRDPYGTPLEVTTYDYDVVRDALWGSERDSHS